MTTRLPAAATAAPQSDLEKAVDALRASFPKETLTLYAMGLYLRTRDLKTLEVENVVDGKGDKKVDFFHVDNETGVATVVQSYESDSWSKPNPKVNKASDLNTAVAWLLEADLNDIPNKGIKAAAQELRDGLADGTIKAVEVVFVHNLPHNKDVDTELETVAANLRKSLDRYASPNGTPRSRAIQLGFDDIDARRRSANDAIVVTDELALTSVTDVTELTGTEWHAVLGTVEATGLVAWHKTYGDELFNANVRDYLGSRDMARNINNQIQNTATTEPDNFWIFNNGITMLTNDVKVSGRTVTLSGVSIINGAQTTGSLADAAKKAAIAGANVPFRVIECRDPELVARIIRFNNLQNPVTAWDRRSIDSLQLDFEEKFKKLGITYQLRRGEARRKATDVLLERLGPHLTAFYGDPITAANKSEVFESEGKYRQAFQEDVDVRHLLFVYRVGEAVASVKLKLRALVEAGGAPGVEAEKTYQYFRYGTFPQVVIQSVGRVLGVWLARTDADYLHKVAMKGAPASWEPALQKLIEDAVLPAMVQHLDTVPDAYTKLKSLDGANEVATKATAFIAVLNKMQPDTFKEITDELVLL